MVITLEDLIHFMSILESNKPIIGTGDFRPYWTTSYLLNQGQDFSDPGLIDQIERTLNGLNKSFKMIPLIGRPSGCCFFFWGNEVLLTGVVIVIV